MRHFQTFLGRKWLFKSLSYKTVLIMGWTRLNSNIRIYRYRPGHCFGRHYDESNGIVFGPDKIPAKMTWTLLIYLSICSGGETMFYPEGSGRKGEKTPDPISVKLEVGLALLHCHGQECLLHE